MVVLCNTPYTNTDTELCDYFAQYPYPLSDFQKYAIEGIVKEQHVLVTAHTGSGKTLPAEFAIRYFHSRGKKLIYTSPIKALSNQKFYDFTQKFPDIQFGLFTGDIKTNPEADVLIMTTEILMNTLFNRNATETKTLQFQMDFDLELAAVVFDEIHYINDEDRGQVWEKSLLMLPPHIQMIMLSATIDDPERFARWCEQRPGTTKQVYLSSTHHRVVPLSHYTYMTIPESNLKLIKDKAVQQQVRKYSNNIHCIQNEKGNFRSSVHTELIQINEVLQSYKIQPKRKFVLNDLAKYLRDHEMLPAIGFLFSRKQVEQCGLEMTTPLLEEDSKIPYMVKRECDQVLRRLPNHEEYMRLPEYIQLVSLLEKGIGIHHSGMIPILREIVELCITKKYIKLLFATESFAIGLDCPIKTAMFLSLRKFDGNNDRGLHSHEYTQMAGRAGRRGIDTVGYVIHCNNLFKPPSESTYREMLCGKPPRLVSKYKISYTTVLNVVHRHKHRVPLSKIVDFTNNSMMYQEVQKEIQDQQKLVEQLRNGDAHRGTFCCNTPYEVCAEYYDLKEKSKHLGNKKKKDCLKRMSQLADQYRKIETDIEVWKTHEKKRKETENEEAYLGHLEKYIENKTHKICSVLESQGFLDRCLDETYSLTQLGTFASQIAEVDSVPWAICLVKRWDFLPNFTTEQIVGLLSCATDIKVPEQYRKHAPLIEDETLASKLRELKSVYDEYAQYELDHNITSGIDYENPLMYDIVEDAMAWCACDSEESCKLFITERLQDREIAIGDFTKAMMKIATIARELQTMSDMECCQGQIEWLHKLSQIEDMVLKYIATNQSLYV